MAIDLENVFSRKLQLALFDAPTLTAELAAAGQSLTTDFVPVEVDLGPGGLVRGANHAAVRRRQPEHEPHSVFGPQQIFWAKIGAMSVLGTLPVFLTVAMAQKLLVRGISMGAVQG